MREGLATQIRVMVATVRELEDRVLAVPTRLNDMRLAAARLELLGLRLEAGR
jgi:hypothetical protein